MLKRKLCITMLIALIAVPSLLISTYAIDEQSNYEISTCADTPEGFMICLDCDKLSHTSIREHSGYFDCSYDTKLTGSYSCTKTNYAKTSVSRCKNTYGEKTAYVYEENVNGKTKSNLKTATGYNFPATASVNPVNTFVPIVVSHRINVPHPETGKTPFTHYRNYRAE
jgi:hypothetical protein